MTFKLGDFLAAVDFDFNLVQLLNIETATLGVSGVRFSPKCDECRTIEDVFFDCEVCEKTTQSFAQIRSGGGDGVYPVFQCMRGLGVAVLFDSRSDFVELHREWALGGEPIDPSLIPHLGDLLKANVFCVGTLQVNTNDAAEANVNQIAMADALADERDAIVVGDAGFGEVNLYVVMGTLDRESEVQVPLLLIAAGQDGIPDGLAFEDNVLDRLSDSAGKDWFSSPVSASLGGGLGEFALFQTARHCQAVAEMCQDASNGKLMAMWVARGLASIAKLQSLKTDLAATLIANVNSDFSEGGFADWWVPETKHLLNELGESEEVLSNRIKLEAFFQSLEGSTPLVQGAVKVRSTAIVNEPRPKFCSECGTPLPETGLFCSNCGHKFAE
jgi:hypothetical protein